MLQYGEDGEWRSSFQALNVETGERVDIAGMTRSFDVFGGGEGEDVIRLTSGDDAIFLDDRYSLFPEGEGPRVAGVETIDAGAGDDLVDLTSLVYSYGDVTINGGAGDDILWASGGDDTIDGGIGDDSLFGGAGDDTLIGGTGENVIDGGDGIDTVDYSGMTSAVDVDLDDNEAETRGHRGRDYDDGDDADEFEDEIKNVENVIGTDEDDKIRGDDADNVLTGGAGNDDLRGREGADTLFGGLGNDDLRGDDGEDVLDGGEGNDHLRGGGGDDDVLFGGAGSDHLRGEDDDVLWGDLGDDHLDGGSGDDVLHGGAGDDHVDGDSGDDILWGGEGDDRLHGGSGTDTVDYSDTTEGVFVDLEEQEATGAESGTDDLRSIENVTGGAPATTPLLATAAPTCLPVVLVTTLCTVAAATTLIGGSGEDMLYGGDGADTFLYEQASDGGDQIMDFESGEDTLAFSQSAFVVDHDTLTGEISADEFAVIDGFGSDQSGGADSAFVFDSTSGEVFYDQGGGEGYTLVADLGENVELTSNDFRIV